jgi:hypothetical protein
MAKSVDSIFITGNVWAEMRKSVTYNVDIELCGKTSTISQCQCDCSAGQGPTAHCKHVGCVLYAIHQFTMTKEILTEVTCTQVSQLFTCLLTLSYLYL